MIMFAPGRRMADQGSGCVGWGCEPIQVELSQNGLIHLIESVYGVLVGVCQDHAGRFVAHAESASPKDTQAMLVGDGDSPTEALDDLESRLLSAGY